jgi:hypothetical protein
MPRGTAGWLLNLGAGSVSEFTICALSRPTISSAYRFNDADILEQFTGTRTATETLAEVRHTKSPTFLRLGKECGGAHYV